MKTKTSGSWHARGSRDGIQRIEDPAESSFWVFVDLAPAFPTFYVTPRWWVQNDIWTAHTAYLERHEREHGAPRESDHHGILVQRVERGTAGMFWRSS